MDYPEDVRSAFASSQIDVDTLIRRSQQDNVKRCLIDLTHDAVDRAAFGAPTFFVGTEMFFGKNQFFDVEESIVAAKSWVNSAAP